MDKVDHPQVGFSFEAREINDTGFGKEDVKGVGLRVAQDVAGQNGLEGGFEPLALVELGPKSSWLRKPTVDVFYDKLPLDSGRKSPRSFQVLYTLTTALWTTNSWQAQNRCD
jgi:hypothetical protein